jgi:hypothetical protein
LFSVIPPLFSVLPSFSKILPPSQSVAYFSPSPKFLPPPIRSPSLLFISRKRGSPPALSHRGAGGKRATLPLQGKVAGHLQGMVSLSFIYHIGRVCGSMGYC